MKVYLLSYENYLTLDEITSTPMIFDIQRYSLHDGAGIRTLIFFKGCPLHCLWCSNPESQSFDPELMYDLDRCMDFGDCIIAGAGAISPLSGHGIELNRSMITRPETLRRVCVSRALTLSGESKSAEQLIDEVMKDQPFYRNGGGVTLSGGEPLAHREVLDSLLQQLNQRGINVNVETSLHVGWPLIQRCLGQVHTFLVDLKHTDHEKFSLFTGGDAGLVLNNLKQLVDFGAPVIIRIPVIPGFNHSRQEMELILDFAATLKGVREVHFLPYHTLGTKKYRMLGRDYAHQGYQTVHETELLPYLAYARNLGFTTNIGG
jgi:pyruvate formate lyase activating enzyme